VLLIRLLQEITPVDKRRQEEPGQKTSREDDRQRLESKGVCSVFYT